LIDCVIAEKVIKEQSARLTDTEDQIAAAIQVFYSLMSHETLNPTYSLTHSLLRST